MLELARKNDARVIFASTSEAYGDAQIIPTPETYWGNVNPVGLRSCYDEGKRFGEALCMAYNRMYGLDVRIVRIFNTYGPRLRSDGFYGRALSRFIDQALSGRDITVYGNGDQTRSFCYVTDTLRGILLAAIAREMKGQVVNIGNPTEVSILELAENIKALTRSSSEITFHPRPSDDPQRRCPDISKARGILGWSPTTTLEEGLRNTIEWFRQRREPAR
jgi:UDP-glucuronate decarboxylase